MPEIRFIRNFRCFTSSNPLRFTQAFFLAGPRAWNALLADLLIGASMRDVFKENLKTFLFNEAYPVINPTISLGSHQNIRLHTGACAKAVLLTYLL